MRFGHPSGQLCQCCSLDDEACRSVAMGHKQKAHGSSDGRGVFEYEQVQFEM